jgi:hypothetical protein
LFKFLFFLESDNVEMIDIVGTAANTKGSASLQRAAASIASVSASVDSANNSPLAELIDIETDANAANYPVEDSDAQFNVAAWAGVPVQLKSHYQPFVSSLVAESRDELKALRDIAFVQEDLHRAHTKLSTLQRREVFLKAEVSAEAITPEDRVQSQKSKSILHFLTISSQNLKL